MFQTCSGTGLEYEFWTESEKGSERVHKSTQGPVQGLNIQSSTTTDHQDMQQLHAHIANRTKKQAEQVVCNYRLVWHRKLVRWSVLKQNFRKTVMWTGSACHATRLSHVRILNFTAITSTWRRTTTGLSRPTQCGHNITQYLKILAHPPDQLDAWKHKNKCH